MIGKKFVSWGCIALLVLVAGCGFKLRGSYSLPAELKVLYLESHEPYGDFTKVLERTLKSRGVLLKITPAQAPVILGILSDGFDLGSIDNRATEQKHFRQVTYTVTYQLNLPTGEIIIGPESIRVQRDQIVDINQVQQDEQELLLLQQDIRRDAVPRLLARLSSTRSVDALKEYIHVKSEDE